MEKSQLYWNSQLIDKRVSFYPKPQQSPNERPQVAAHLSENEQQQLRAIHRGHLGIPEEIMKAGSAQYATMCNNINNKVRKNKDRVFSCWITNFLGTYNCPTQDFLAV